LTAVPDHSDVRQIALSLPEVTEQDHHGMVSFRVQNKIFATVPDDEHVRIMVNEPAIPAAVAEFPDVCEPFYWGRRLACVVVNISGASSMLVEDLLTDAWLRKSPRRVERRLGIR
jgi:hypothetical protein